MSLDMGAEWSSFYLPSCVPEPQSVDVLIPLSPNPNPKVQEALGLCLLATGDAAFDREATRGKKFSDLYHIDSDCGQTLLNLMVIVNPELSLGTPVNDALQPSSPLVSLVDSLTSLFSESHTPLPNHHGLSLRSADHPLRSCSPPVLPKDSLTSLSSGSLTPLPSHDSPSSQLVSLMDLTPVHFWQNKVLVLSPTAAQYHDFPTFLESAEALDKHGVGAILVNAPPSMEKEMPLTLQSFASTECLRYEVRRRQGGIFEVQLPFCSDVLNPVRSSSVDPVSTTDYLDQLEDLLHTSKNLENACYLPDIPAKTPEQRRKAGLPPTSMVWPNSGDQLTLLPKKTPGLHSPFAYVADERFGAVFNCHREDYDLHSINFLHMGRKIWIIIPASHCAALETRFRETKIYQRQFTCDQFLRHHQITFTRGQLEDWEIPYHVVDQRAGQFVITLPKVYHQGFSPASSIAEAVNYGGKLWSITDCISCTTQPCGPHAILRERMLMRPPLPAVLQSGHSVPKPSTSLASSSSALPSPATKATKATSAKSKAKKRKASTVEDTITTAVPLSNKRVLKVTFNMVLTNLRLPKAFITPQQVMGAFSRSVNAELLTGLFIFRDR